MKRILIISDGKPGHLNQSIAFCKIKEISYDILKVNFKTKFSKILSYIYDNLSIYKTDIFKETRHINYEFYNAIVSTGSGTYYFNKVLSKKNKIKSIVLMLPKSYNYKDFDYIIAQEHDNPPILSNLIKIPLNLSFSKPKGLISKIDDKKSLGIIIGGNNDIFTMDYKSIKEELDLIFQKYENHLKYITTSRRTPKEIDDLISTYDFDYKLIYSEEPTINPIPDFLDRCEELFISIDSTSMLSEARANSKSKINIINLKSKKKNTKFHKLASIVKNLEEQVDFKKLLEKIEI